MIPHKIFIYPDYGSEIPENTDVLMISLPLREFYCLNNLKIPSGIKEINMSLNNLESFKNNLKHTSLKNFKCQNNKFRSFNNLPVFPDCLEILNVSLNYIKDLPESFPRGLKVLDLFMNCLEHVCCLSGLEELEELYLSHNKITEITEIPKKLKILFCDHNQLTKLPELPPRIVELDTSYNQLIELPELPKGLKELNASHNQIATIKEFPRSLRIINVSYNMIRVLPPIPDNVKVLNFSSTLIQEVPKVPRSIVELNYDNCPITIDRMKNYLRYLNNLEELSGPHYPIVVEFLNETEDRRFPNSKSLNDLKN